MDTGFRPSGTHEWHSEEYVSEWISGDATRDDERRPRLERLAGLIPAEDRSTRVLDIGGGYGVLAEAVLERWPDASVTLHDYSEAMIEAARTRLERFGPRVTFHLADMTRPGWLDGLGEPFDAVVSALAVHNVEEPDLIRGVYRDLYGIVRPGGALLTFDLVFPTLPGLAELYQRDPTRDLNWDARVGTADVRDHLAWLQEAGFDEVDCVWKDLEQGLLWARRTA